MIEKFKQDLVNCPSQKLLKNSTEVEYIHNFFPNYKRCHENENYLELGPVLHDKQVSADVPRIKTKNSAFLTRCPLSKLSRRENVSQMSLDLGILIYH